VVRDPITIPGDCQRTWDALNGRVDFKLHIQRGGWYGSFDLQRLAKQSCADRKARKLRKLGVLDWRDVVDHVTGGKFVEFKVACEPGHGRDLTARRNGLGGSADQPAASDQTAGLLFEVPPRKATREDFETARRPGG